MSYCYKIRVMFLGLFFDGLSGNRDFLSPSTVVLMVFGHFSTSQALYALVSTRQSISSYYGYKTVYNPNIKKCL